MSVSRLNSLYRCRTCPSPLRCWTCGLRGTSSTSWRWRTRWRACGQSSDRWRTTGSPPSPKTSRYPTRISFIYICAYGFLQPRTSIQLAHESFHIGTFVREASKCAELYSKTATLRIEDFGWFFILSLLYFTAAALLCVHKTDGGGSRSLM